MRAALLALGLLAASAHVARADGWSLVCSERENPGGCDGTTACSCETGHSSSAASDAASIGTGLALLGFVGYRITRKRRSR